VKETLAPGVAGELRFHGAGRQDVAPHLDEGEMSLGVHVDVSHDAATRPASR
jgi:predicted thioesterase